MIGNAFSIVFLKTVFLMLRFRYIFWDWADGASCRIDIGKNGVLPRDISYKFGQLKQLIVPSLNESIFFSS